MNDIGNLLVIQGLLTDNLAQIFCGFYFIHSDARRNLERNTALANQLADTERRLAWHKNRVQYHSTARSLLSRAQSCVSENEAIAILNELNAMLAKFSANKSYLNANDNEFLDLLEAENKKYMQIVQAQQDSFKQARIHKIIEEMHELLAVGDVIAAHAKLIEARALAHSVNDVKNIINQEITTVNDLDSAVKLLDAEKQLYIQRRIDLSRQAAADIVNGAVKKLVAKDGSGAILYSLHQEILQEKICKAFMKNWSKFDRREIPEAFKLELQQLIANRRKDIGNKKYYYDWCRSNISIRGIDACLHEIDVIFEAYKPKEQPPAISVNIGASTSMDDSVVFQEIRSHKYRP